MSKWNPDEHLPECGVTRYPICICDRLRACEQRVLDVAEAAITEALKERMVMADCSPNTMRAPLLAIRALKEKP